MSSEAEVTLFEHHRLLRDIIDVVKHHRMGRNFLKGTAGDQLNTILSACGYNFKKIYNHFLKAYRIGSFFYGFYSLGWSWDREEGFSGLLQEAGERKFQRHRHRKKKGRKRIPGLFPCLFWGASRGILGYS